MTSDYLSKRTLLEYLHVLHLFRYNNLLFFVPIAMLCQAVFFAERPAPVSEKTSLANIAIGTKMGYCKGINKLHVNIFIRLVHL